MRVLRPKHSGFTLIELAVTMMIMAVLTTMGIIYLTKEVERVRYRNVRLNLTAIHAAFQMYVAKNGSYPSSVNWDLDDLNVNLGLNIQDDDFTYTYDPGPFGPYDVETARNLPTTDWYWVSVSLQTPVTVSNPICASPGLGANCPQLY